MWKVLIKSVHEFMILPSKMELDLWNFKIWLLKYIIVKTYRTLNPRKMKLGSPQRRQIGSSFEKIQIQRKDLKVKNQFWSAYFSGSMYCERFSCLSVCFPFFTFHGPFTKAYIFLLLILFFLVHFDFLCPVSLSLFS